MKRLTSFYSEGELSAIRVSSVEQTVEEVKGLFFREQLVEEQILLEILSSSKGECSQVDELRLDFDRIYSRKQIIKKSLLKRFKFIDSAKYEKDFPIQTILDIKNEERYLNAKFKDFFVLVPRQRLFSKAEEPMLFATLRNNNFYLLNESSPQVKPSFFKRLGDWIQKKISFRTSSK